MNLPSPRQINTVDLLFDAQNPRILERGSDLSQTDILRVLWEDFAVDEIAFSIAANGFFDHEPLMGEVVAADDEKIVVIEGNRRLAAVRLLTNDDLRIELGATGLPSISTEETQALRTLPVITCERKVIWQFIGFKHVNGAQPWDSYAKAEYIAYVRNGIGAALDDIAKSIGDRHSTVRRLYRAYMALRQAETIDVYQVDDRARKHFSFSHLYTGLDYEGIARFTGVTGEDSYDSKSPVPTEKLEPFGEFCVWLWGSKSQDRAPLIRSQNPDLRNLDKILRSEDGVAAIRAGEPIDDALHVARGATGLLRDTLVSSLL